MKYAILLLALCLPLYASAQSPIITGGDYVVTRTDNGAKKSFGNQSDAKSYTTKLFKSCSCDLVIYQPPLHYDRPAASSSSKASVASSSVAKSSVSSSGAKLLWKADFNNGALLGIAQNGATASIVDGAYKISYPKATEGAQYSWLNYDAPEGTKQLYISFKAKMPGNKAGLKFVKVFGKREGDAYANTTFGLDYTGIDDGIGTLYAISFGDGTDRIGDSQNVIFLDGTYPSYAGRSYGKTAIIKTPMKKNFKASDWGTTWHDFRIMIKFNDATTNQNEVANGAYYLAIDGDVYVDATGLFNRHFASTDISHVEFGGWAQGARGVANPAFDIYYDDIVISSGGWLNSAEF